MKIALAAMTLGLALGPCAAKTPAADQMTSPQQAFGFAPGADRKLADWKQLRPYYQRLARQSPRVRYAELGKRTEVTYESRRLERPSGGCRLFGPPAPGNRPWPLVNSPLFRDSRT
jgi:hypothetical protein